MHSVRTQRVKRRNYKKNYRKNYKQNNGNKSSTLTNIAKIAGTALSTAKFVASLVNVEYKYTDTAFSLSAQTWGGMITSLCVPAQGVGALQRTGDSIKMKTLTMRGSFEYNPTGITYESVRIIIIIDKENSITLGNQYFAATGSNVAPYAPKFADNKFDTKVLYDRIYSINPNTFNVPFEAVIKIDQHSHFNAGTAVVDKNALKLITIAQSPVNGPFLNFYSRVSYIDN